MKIAIHRAHHLHRRSATSNEAIKDEPKMENCEHKVTNYNELKRMDVAIHFVFRLELTRSNINVFCKAIFI